MKWLAKAGCLVVEGWVTEEIEADSIEEAELRAEILARRSPIADSGNIVLEPLEEDKQLICNMLLCVLQYTRNLFDVVDLTYDPEKETVTALFESGYTKTANVAADSGTSMIRDIIGQII